MLELNLVGPMQGAVVELGAGLGLPGLLIAKQQQEQGQLGSPVLLTDFHPRVPSRYWCIIFTFFLLCLAVCELDSICW